MDMDTFIKAYFGAFATKLAPYGYDPEKLISAIWAGTSEMIKNTGERTNEKAFWKKFCEVFGQDALKDEPISEYPHGDMEQLIEFVNAL